MSNIFRAYRNFALHQTITRTLAHLSVFRTGSAHIHNFPVRHIFKSIIFSCDSGLMVYAIISAVRIDELSSNFSFWVLCGGFKSDLQGPNRCTRDRKRANALLLLWCSCVKNKLSSPRTVGGKCRWQKKHTRTDPQSFKHDLRAKSHPLYLCLSSFCVTRHFH